MTFFNQGNQLVPNAGLQSLKMTRSLMFTHTMFILYILYNVYSGFYLMENRKQTNRK